MQPLEVTLIVAASRNMGIGFQGAMPWKGLRKEMQYFARTTTQLPPHTSATTKNAVIMGRKTWDSIPPKFRPLKDRLNIVITRSTPAAAPSSLSSSSAIPGDSAPQEVRVSSIEQALQYAQAHSVGRVFVMGGAQIYNAALQLPTTRRILLTSIDKEFECDTTFPLDLSGEKSGLWQRKSREELQEWTGQEVNEGGQEEAGIQYEFQMWEKVD